MNDMPSFGYWLRRRRKALDLTQDALAQQVGCATATIKKIEQDERRPSKQMAERLAIVLQLPENERTTFVNMGLGVVSALRLVESSNNTPTPNIIPAPLTSLIGREAELAQLTVLLTSLQPPTRLVTLTGMGGIGKTHLAQSAAAQLAPHFADGVLYVSLAPVREVDLVLPSIARQMGIHDINTSQIFDKLSKYLMHRHQLIILDNVEHVVAIAPQLQALLQQTQRLKILITSRAVLHVSFENVLALNPLSLSETMTLLKQRIRQMNTVTDLDAVEDLLHTIALRLNGLPLAIELAASQLRLFSLSELLARLNTPLHRLSARNPATRQREFVLRDMLDRSYELLAEPEQRLFRSIGIFVGGASLQAVNALMNALMATGDSQYSAESTEDGLLTLIESSLIKRDTGANGASRYMMHEFVREYARERLTTQGEFLDVAHRHAIELVNWAEALHSAWLRYELAEVAYFDALEADHHNVLAALGWMQAELAQTTKLNAAEAVKLAVRLIQALDKYWTVRGYARENEAALSWAFAHRHYLDADTQATLCYRVCQLLWHQRDSAPASNMAWVYAAVDEGYRLAEAKNDLIWMAWYEDCHASIAMRNGQVEPAEAILDIAYAHIQTVHDHAITHLQSVPKNVYGVWAGNTFLRAQAAEMRHDFTGMCRLCEQSIKICEQGRLESFLVINRLILWARALIAQGKFTESHAMLAQSFALCEATHNMRNMPLLIHGVAMWFGRQNNPERITFFMSMAETLRENSGAGMEPSGKATYDATLAEAQSLLTQTHIQAAWQAGSRLDANQAVAELRLWVNSLYSTQPTSASVQT